MVKKYNILKMIMAMAAALVLAGSCSKDRPVIMPDLEICFDIPTVASMSRPIVTRAGYPDDMPFYSWAKLYAGAFESWNSGTLYIDRAEISYVDGNWTPDGPCYWPKNESSSLAFFGFSHGSDGISGSFPADGIGVNENGIYIEDYEMETDGTQSDMMVSDPVVDKKSGTVSFNFNHILSSLVFKVRLADGMSKITLNEFFLKDVVIRGDFSQGLKGGTVPTGTDGMVWTPSDAAADVADYHNVVGSGGVEVASAAEYVDLNSSSPLFILPQKTSRGADDKIRIHLNYTKTDGVTVERDVVLPDVTEFAIGKKYVFELTISDTP